ncbi:MAG: shikimate kinase [Actinobacteria bacterium]|nr:shikimate kinase [Actinomycetota bacterium]
MAPRAIFIGPMGSGKSTIGKAVAKSLKLTFRDTDTEIEKLENMSVSQIFLDKGEEYFRSVEKTVLRQELLSDETVLALGGGAPMSVDAQSALRAISSKVFYLDISLANVAPRIGFNRDRPLLLTNPRGQWQTLMEQRRPIYESIADVVIDVNNRSERDVVKQVLEVLV